MSAAVRIARSAFQVPRKGTFYRKTVLTSQEKHLNFEMDLCLNMHTNGIYLKVSFVAHVFRKEAIQKTIAAMTLGKDVSALFPDVLKNIATHDLGQKKLVYLYLMYPFALKLG